MTMQQAIEKAKANLPEGWTLRIYLEPRFSI
jgi:hypothetical protein